MSARRRRGRTLSASFRRDAGATAILVGLSLATWAVLTFLGSAADHESTQLASSSGSVTPHEPMSAQPDPGAALAAALELPEKEAGPQDSYDRERFGTPWTDVDGNGCDTRNDILARDLTDLEFEAGTGGCIVLSGIPVDPYSGTTIAFRRGPSTSGEVQIDHVVALSDAWQKGARTWSAAKRERFANDPLNLLASDGGLNAAKGDSDAAEWLLPNKAFHCAYMARQVEVNERTGSG